MRHLSIIILMLILGFGANGQIIQAPELICASKKQNGDVELTWELPTNTCGTFSSYHIYYSTDPNGPFTLIDSVTNQAATNFTHIGADCNNNINYYYITTSRDCPGGTALTSDTLDCLDPQPPVIDYVSVYNGGVEIHFQPSTSPEAVGYIIYRDAGGFNPIDTIYGRLNNFYYDQSADPKNNIEIYTIATIDACDNVGPFNSNPHQTILMTTSAAQCRPSIDLIWTPYNNWPNDTFREHIVEYSIDGGVYTQDTVLPASVLGYTFSEFRDGDEICVRVGTRHPTDTFISYSNAYCEKVQIVQPAEFLYITNATVVNNQEVLVTWQPDQNADLASINVRRSTDGQNFSLINTQNAPAFPPQEMSYTDTDPRSLENSKFYQIETIDSCDNAKRSGLAHTMFLQGKAKPNFTNTIEWNPFEITYGVVEEYLVYRNINGNWNLLATLPPDTIANSLRYDDDISDLFEDQGQFCYRIEANGYVQLPSGDTVNFTSFSNDACLSQLTKVYAPTALVIGGKNNFFKPVISFENPETYQLRIFNRWGELLFQTSDINEGWYGNHNGEIVQQGVYTYLITVTGVNSDIVEEKGTFVVIR